MESAEGNLAAAATNFERVRDTWAQVRPAVRTHAEDVVARGLDQLIAEQQAALWARNPAWLAASAGAARQMIDDLQQLSY
jgi:hypothetical protein